MRSMPSLKLGKDYQFTRDSFVSNCSLTILSNFDIEIHSLEQILKKECLLRIKTFKINRISALDTSWSFLLCPHTIIFPNLSPLNLFDPIRDLPDSLSLFFAFRSCNAFVINVIFKCLSSSSCFNLIG